MMEWAASLPPYLKYIVITWVPWIELRGAIPLAVQQGEQGYIPLIIAANMLVYPLGRLFLEYVYHLIPGSAWVHRKLEGIREKAHPMVERYGFWGLTIFVAVPLPGTGAYAGTAAAWLLELGWRKGLAAVWIGVAIAGGAVWALAEGVAAGLGLF